MAITNADRVLLAALTLDKSGEHVFTSEALAVECWVEYPECFALKGFLNHPDNNKVVSIIVGKTGLVRRGDLLQVGPKLYQVTDIAKAYLKKHIIPQITGEQPEEEVGSNPAMEVLPREFQVLINHTLNHFVVHKFDSGEKTDINFVAACDFWRLPKKISYEEALTYLTSVEQDLGKAEASLEQNDKLLPSGQVVGARDINKLKNIHNWLKFKFDRHFKFFRHVAKEKIT